MTSKLIVNNIESDAGVSTVTFSGDITANNLNVLSGNVQVQSINNLNYPTAGPLSNRNLIINGDMRIDQRNAGASVTADNSFAVDRFVFRTIGGGAITAQQSTTAPTGFANSYSITVSTADGSIAAGDNYQLVQRIEGYNTDYLLFGTSSAKSVTLSFWVRSSLTGTFGGNLQNSAADRSYVFQYTINAANTWEYKTITIAGDTSGTWLTTNVLGVAVTWDLGSGSNFEGTANAWNAANNRRASGNVQLIGTLNATFYVSGVQLEVGTVATPFEHRSFGDELARCCRYYQKSYNQEDAPGTATDIGSVGSRSDGSATMTVHPGTVFRHTMRAAPTVTLYSPNDGVADRVSDRGTNLTSHANNQTVNNIFAAGQNGFVSITLAAAEGPSISYHYTADAEL